MPLSPELRDLLALHLLPKIGPRRTAALLAHFGSARAVLDASAEQLAGVPGIGTVLADELRQARADLDVDAEIQHIERDGVSLLALGQPGYPEPLAQIDGAPHVLYVRGSLDERDNRAVALVGSRHCTSYGRRCAAGLATGLVRAGYTIVSGLARGIDGEAHRAALKAGGRTIAVLAGGLSRIYPPEHKGLAEEVQASGALLSEAAMRQEPLAALFPGRNRLISGLSAAVVIVEAAEKSGALITARLGAEQGRSVLAVPGLIDSEASGGTNALIRTGAVLCRGVDDILEELHGVRATAPVTTPPPQAPPPPALDETQRRVWECLAEQARHLDELVRQLGLSVSELSAVLLTLEMKSVIRRLPGNRYERC
jgi:DNA processing protein